MYCGLSIVAGGDLSGYLSTHIEKETVNKIIMKKENIPTKLRKTVIMKATEDANNVR